MRRLWHILLPMLAVVFATAGCGGDEGHGNGWDGGNGGGGGGGNGGGGGDDKPTVSMGPTVLPDWEDDNLARAFPGAEGGGMYTTGGRGGEVYHVTNLNDSGAGSLREAIGRSGARTIVFDVAGVISLGSTLEIKNGNVTIAGQTAPGDGICVRNYPVVVKANNVIIRYMRFRMGDEAKAEGDAIWGRYNSDIVLDHCSMSWSTDECASFYANRNFTMQWCIITESLRSSVHGKGNHGYGGIWGGRNASFHHNMLSCHDSRNPRIDHPEIYDTYLTTHRGNVDLRNNVIYNWGGNSTYGGEGGSFNVVGNYYKPGPASKERNYFVDAYNKTSSVVYDYPRLYMSGNYHAGSPTLAQSSWVYWHQGGSAPLLDVALPIRADDTKACYVTTHEAAVAFERVTGYAGASKVRDAVDVRAVADARGGTATFPSGGNGSTGGIIDTQSAVGGWPTYAAGTKIADSDGDGMSDEWETLCGLDPADAADGKTMTIDTDGRYTNLELYLHYLVQDTVLAQCADGSYSKSE